ncbi:MAG TPA: hypothetical protein VFP36_09430 [Usitatibacter sp.]|nr:hypothetical protein [Usitatibacter sp.]
MSVALLLIGLVVLVLGLPFLAAAFGFIVWAMGRGFALLLPARPLRRPVA